MVRVLRLFLPTFFRRPMFAETLNGEGLVFPSQIKSKYSFVSDFMAVRFPLFLLFIPVLSLSLFLSLLFLFRPSHFKSRSTAINYVPSLVEHRGGNEDILTTQYP